MFNEDNTIEQMVLATLQANGWKYIEAEKLSRHYSDVMVESMVRDALIRLNPEIAEDPSSHLQAAHSDLVRAAAQPHHAE